LHNGTAGGVGGEVLRRGCVFNMRGNCFFLPTSRERKSLIGGKFFSWLILPGGSVLCNSHRNEKWNTRKTRKEWKADGTLLPPPQSRKQRGGLRKSTRGAEIEDKGSRAA